MTDCPCGSGQVLPDCCGPFLDGHPAPTAEALMRSRYSAYVMRNDDHLFRTWHPRTRPDVVRAPAEITWTGLRIVRLQAGGVDDDEGIVEFVADHVVAGESEQLHETSRFERRAGRWTYVAAQ